MMTDMPNNWHHVCGEECTGYTITSADGRYYFVLNEVSHNAYLASLHMREAVRSRAREFAKRYNTPVELVTDDWVIVSLVTGDEK